MSLTTDELAELLRREIETGRRREGSRLPSIPDLMAGYKVGKGIAQNAVKKLREAGLIATKPGGATLVQGGYRRQVVQEPAGDGPDWVAAMAVTQVGEVPAPAFVAEQFSLREGEPVFLRKGVDGVELKMSRLISAYVPVELARGTAISYTDMGAGGIHARLAEQGFGPNRTTASVISRVATPGEEQVLSLRRGVYVIEMTRSAWSGRRCVEVVRFVLDSAVHELRFALLS